MADMIARENVTGFAREPAEVNDLRPAHKPEAQSNQPSAEVRKRALKNLLGSHVISAPLFPTSDHIGLWSNSATNRILVNFAIPGNQFV